MNDGACDGVSTITKSTGYLAKEILIQ